MTRRLAAHICGLCALTALGASAASAATGSAAPLKSARVGKLGTIVVDAKGRTLYHLTSETNQHISCTGICTQFWRPVLAESKMRPKLGPGLNAMKVGTVRRPGGALQLTYAGFPLYRYYLDKEPGQHQSEGARYGVGVWYAVSATGKAVKVATPLPAPTTSTTSTVATTTTSSSGGGY
jgi:predicted lipoprotein with Yx(FWY)xxD motif